MPKTVPDHIDAELVLKVYDLRREAVMRKSRDAINGQFWPKRYEDVAAVMTNFENPLNAAWRQVGTYWEMVYGMARHGIVHADYFVENNGEGLFLFAKIEPFLEQIRRDASPLAFQNTQWVAREPAAGRRIYEIIGARVRKMMEGK